MGEARQPRGPGVTTLRGILAPRRAQMAARMGVRRVLCAAGQYARNAGRAGSSAGFAASAPRLYSEAGASDVVGCQERQHGC